MKKQIAAPVKESHSTGPIRPIRTASRGSAVFVAMLLACSTSALLFPASAMAAVTITTQRGASGITTVYADGDRLRIDSPARDPGGRAHVMIMDADGKRMVTLDESTKTYTELTEEDMKRVRGRMDGMREQMEERMKSMPPEQRKKMEEMMAGRGGMGVMGGPGAMGRVGAAAKPREWTFEPLGQKKSVNGFSCEMYRVNVDGKPREEDCISPWSAGLVKREDFAGLQKFGEEMSREFGGGEGEKSRGPFMRFDKAPGIPISRVPLEPDGKRGEEEQIKSIKRGAIPSSLFAIPAGFTKKDLPMGPKGPGGPGARRRGPGAP